MFKGSVLSAGILLASTAATAAVQYVRVSWDQDPAHQAVIGFSKDGSSANQYVQYGSSTDDSTWTSKSIDRSLNFSSLTNYFVRLENLTANSDVYFKVCDDSGCSDMYRFKTAPSDDSPYVFVAGGDTRTGWTNRQQGNALISKIRPLFVMHGGDFTNSNNTSEMQQWLIDWQLTYSSDVIDGKTVKRVYPIIPTHGNHEDNNYATLCQVFGVDYNKDNTCNAQDAYAAFNVGSLLRIYTLNSQYKNSGMSSYASAQNAWLANDLSANGNSAIWRVAQYHKPMFPHYSGKSDNTILHTWWADHFYDYAMNLVVESDTHINKMTYALAPNGSSFAATNTGGTVYVGEGSWGAPARSANDAKSWTIDLASIQQFKVITANSDTLDVRTAQFDGKVTALSKAQREASSILLPEGINWWSAQGIGSVLTLAKAANGLSVIESNSSPTATPTPTQTPNGEQISLSASEDTFIAKSLANDNFNASSEGLLADGSDSSYGEMQSLIKWDLSGIAACNQVSAANIELDIFNPSNGSYGIFAANSAWQESTATWANVGGDAIKGAQLASFAPAANGIVSTAINADVTQAWLQQHDGILIASLGSSDGIDIYSKEQARAAKLVLTLDDSACSAATATTTHTATVTPTITSTAIATTTATLTATVLPTSTLTLTATPSITATLTNTPTVTSTLTATLIPTSTLTATATATASATATATITITLSNTATNTATATLTATATPSLTNTATVTATPSSTNTVTITATELLATASATPSSNPSATITEEPSATNVVTPIQVGSLGGLALLLLPMLARVRRKK